MNTPQALEKTPIAVGGRVVEGTTQPIRATGNSGMDKTYYHNDGDKFGWLETKPAVVERELAAYAKLDGLKTEGIKFAQVIKPSDAQEHPSLVNKDGAKNPAASGYFVEHLNFTKPFKPKMAPLAAMAAARTYNKLPNEAKLQMRTDIQAIQSNLGQIADVVGELTLAVNPQTGSVYLLDVAPNENGEVGGQELVNTAGEGLKQMLDACKAPSS